MQQLSYPRYNFSAFDKKMTRLLFSHLLFSMLHLSVITTALPFLAAENTSCLLSYQKPFRVPTPFLYIKKHKTPQRKSSQTHPLYPRFMKKNRKGESSLSLKSPSVSLPLGNSLFFLQKNQKTNLSSLFFCGQ
jgi:hypothetical protein